LKLFRPYKYIENLTDLSSAELEQDGISYLLIDLDDTLVASYANDIDQGFVGWLEQLQADGIKIIVLSNGKAKHVASWLKRLDLEGIALSGKPLPIAFARVLKKFAPNKANRSNCAMLGDQLFTDVLGANIYGLRSILVKPLSAGKPHTKLLRKLENVYFEKISLKDTDIGQK